MPAYTWFVPRAMVAILILWTSASFAAEEVTERAVPNVPLMQALPALPGSAPRSTAAAPTLDQTVALLQQQAQALTAQVAALQSVLVVTPTGATLQAPTLSLHSLDGTTIRSNTGVAIQAGTWIDMKSSANTSIRAGSSTLIESSTTLDMKGAVMKLNGGTRPLAVVASQVQVPGQPIGQVLTGSQTIMGN